LPSMYLMSNTDYCAFEFKLVIMSFKFSY
jgi:hypothetical protein